MDGMSVFSNVTKYRELWMSRRHKLRCSSPTASLRGAHMEAAKKPTALTDGRICVFPEFNLICPRVLILYFLYKFTIRWQYTDRKRHLH